MKLKKIASLCAREKRFALYDRISENGEITQWLGDGGAAYPLDGLPVLDKESLCAIFDISDKQRESILLYHTKAPVEVNWEDASPADRSLDDAEMSIIYDGTELLPLRTSRGITLIQRKYLTPLEDVMDVTRLFERVTPNGQSYIVAKTGLLLAAIIFPYSGLSEKLVEGLEGLARLCRRALDEQGAPEDREADRRQRSLFDT